jgi:hypothetical protein
MKRNRFFVSAPAVLLAVALAAAASLALAGCKKDPVKAVQGTWVGWWERDPTEKAEVTVQGNEFWVRIDDNEMGPITFSLTGDEGTISYEGQTLSGSYTLKGDTLTIHTSIWEQTDDTAILQKQK